MDVAQFQNSFETLNKTFAFPQLKIYKFSICLSFQCSECDFVSGYKYLGILIGNPLS